MTSFKSAYLLPMLAVVLMLAGGCTKDSATRSDEAATTTGLAGSYARFITAGNFMYVVDNTTIQTFDLANAAQPQLIDRRAVGENVESIFNLDDKLFIGAGSGLYIYQIGADGIPQPTSSVSHDYPIMPCDPVVADETHAYVTLNTNVEGPCGGVNTVNLLKIFNIADLNAPTLVAEYDMTNPKGVAIDGNTLFLCDDKQGLKVYDVTNPTDIQLIAHFANITTYDVIANNGMLLVVGPKNLYQFDYTDLTNIRQVSVLQIAS